MSRVDVYFLLSSIFIRFRFLGESGSTSGFFPSFIFGFLSIFTFGFDLTPISVLTWLNPAGVSYGHSFLILSIVLQHLSSQSNQSCRAWKVMRSTFVSAGRTMTHFAGSLFQSRTFLPCITLRWPTFPSHSE